MEVQDLDLATIDQMSSIFKATADRHAKNESELRLEGSSSSETDEDSSPGQ